ncbi:MAG TPA: transcriptional regulator [Gemmatimonadales bacterium]|nr:transcriptional regulator [Gemmatimonadales bacterium]
MGKRAAARSEPGARPAARSLRAVSGNAASRASLALDRVIHERVRLAIVSALAVNESLSFIELRDLIGTTDGNLSVHARRLEEAGYVACRKSFEGRVPKTDFQLTPVGRDALERYLSHMEGLIRAVQGSED